MPYKVRLSNGVAKVVDEAGNEVADSPVLGIDFPTRRTATAKGDVHLPTGPRVARIAVGGQIYKGVPLC